MYIPPPPLRIILLWAPVHAEWSLAGVMYMCRQCMYSREVFGKPIMWLSTAGMAAAVLRAGPGQSL